MAQSYPLAWEKSLCNVKLELRPRPARRGRRRQRTHPNRADDRPCMGYVESRVTDRNQVALRRLTKKFLVGSRGKRVEKRSDAARTVIDVKISRGDQRRFGAAGAKSLCKDANEIPSVLRGRRHQDLLVDQV